MSHDEIVPEFLGVVSGTMSLSNEVLQMNKGEGDSDRMRVPSAIAVVLSQKMVLVGFDSGELQCYHGCPDKLEVGPGFRISDDAPVSFIRFLDHWHPSFGDKDVVGVVESVFYSSCGADLILWHVVNGEVRLPWIKYHLPDSANPSYVILDAMLCPAMSKMIAATDRGRLLVYDYEVRRRRTEEEEMHKVEGIKIVKVAHEGAVTCLSSNYDGSLLMSGGSDGHVALWKWGEDEFLHLVGKIFITNMPVVSILFLSEREAVLCLGTHIMSLRITRKNKQVFHIEHFHGKHITLPLEEGKVKRHQDLQLLSEFDGGKERLFLALRSPPTNNGGAGSMEMVGEKIAFPIPGLTSAVLCFDHRQMMDVDSSRYEEMREVMSKHEEENEVEHVAEVEPLLVVTAVAALSGEDGKPEVKFWVKN